MRGDAHPGFDRSWRRIAGGMPLVPAESPRTLLEVFDPHSVRRARRRVLDAELHRIHLHAVRELVHQDLSQKAALWMTGCAHRALLTSVDVNIRVDAAPVRELIQIRQREIRAGPRAAC